MRYISYMDSSSYPTPSKAAAMFDFKVEFSKAIAQAVASSNRNLYTAQAVAELAATLVPADVAKAYGPSMLKSLTRTVQSLRICVA